ncbi:MAG TPA: hypothetical protein VMW38_28135 [Terriglobia bacterium]|nr:hypothetical protein [Terriglobia bacterium]
MGIMTEEAKPTRVMLDDTEFVRTKKYNDHPMELVFSRGTLALSEKCIFYKDNRAGQRTVTIIPFKNIDSFSIQTRRFHFILVVGVTLLLLALGSSIWLLSSAATVQPFQFPHSFSFVSVPLERVWAPALLLICGVIFLVTYSIHRRIELMICTASGNNRVRVLLPVKVSDSVKQFVAGLETQIRAA